jgi:sulfate adenylyltransferase subunit 1 (EFTu-like GTPase family)
MTATESRTLEFRLFDKQHSVSVTLGIARQPAIQRASVWWDDRRRDPTALAFSNVLWMDERKYGAERRYQVPKESGAPQFVAAIEDMVREVSQQATEWYAEARRELDQRAGV